MTLTIPQKRFILERAASFSARRMMKVPTQETEICLTTDELSDGGVTYEDIRLDPTYRGTDYLNGHAPVHVFRQDVLEKDTGLSFADIEKARKEQKSKMQVGG